MNILYCIPALYNAAGMERVLTEKVNYLARNSKYNINIVTTDHLNRPIRFELDNKIRVLHFDIDFVDHFNANLIKKYFKHKKKQQVYKHRLEQLIKELDIDICISLCGKEIDFFSKMDVKCKKIAELHFAMNNRKDFLTSRHNGLMWRVLGRIRTNQLISSVKGLDQLVVLTEVDKMQWDKKCNNAIHIPNPNPLKNDDVSSLHNKKAVAIGRLDAQKGYDMLISAWALVVKIQPDWILNIYGSGELENILLQQIIELNLSQSVFLKGITNDVVENYLDSSIYLMTSRYEGLPMVLIEAISCGLPIVSFDCNCGPREIISNGIDGFLVEPNNVREFATKVIQLIDDEILRKQMGQNAYGKSKMYSLEVIMPLWEKLFSEVLSKQKIPNNL